MNDIDELQEDIEQIEGGLRELGLRKCRECGKWLKKEMMAYTGDYIKIYYCEGCNPRLFTTKRKQRD